MGTEGIGDGASSHGSFDGTQMTGVGVGGNGWTKYTGPTDDGSDMGSDAGTGLGSGMDGERPAKQSRRMGMGMLDGVHGGGDVWEDERRRKLPGTWGAG